MPTGNHLHARLSRRGFLKHAGVAGAAAAGAFGIAGRVRAEAQGRVVILGFDGVAPDIVAEMMAQGELPHLAALRDKGAFSKLKTTIPPQSPVAWSSFMTCLNPGGHNIYDFIRRDPRGSRGPQPYVGTGDMDHPELAPSGDVRAPAKAKTYRKGQTFWRVADEQGARCKILNVPFAFPADTLDNGVQLCGLGVPDLRGTTSTYFELGDDFTAGQLQERLSGGQRLALEFDAGDVAVLEVPGPRDNRHSFREPNAFTLCPLSIRVSREGKEGEASVNGAKVALRQGEWSEWVEMKFDMSPALSVYSVTRFYPMEIGPGRVRIYMACQQFHPSKPYVPFSHPGKYAAELQSRYGLYKTIGWAYDTHALRQDALDEEAFLRDVEMTMAWREKLTLDEIDRGGFDLLISAWTATDRMGHMFWRFRDEKHPLYDPVLAEKYGKALEHSYKIMDGIVGRVVEKLGENDLLMVLSDHGFGSWRTGFSINTWLQEQGYLKVSDPAMAKRGFLLGVDWDNTQAYAIGLSSMYLNLQGRESGGIVPKDQALALGAEIREKLLKVKDPATGSNVLNAVYTSEDYSGQAMDEAPDFSLGYSAYYQNSKEAVKGAVPDGQFELNENKWSGEHAASDCAELPGIFFCSGMVEKDAPDIRDLGVTALKYLGLDVPSEFEGEALV